MKDIQETREVFETSDHAHANRYLKAGWRLLAVLPESDSERRSTVVYVLGWSEQGTPPKPEWPSQFSKE